VLVAMPPELVPLAEQLLSMLQARHLVRPTGNAPSTAAPSTAAPSLAGLLDHVGVDVEQALAGLARARVTVAGNTLAARTLLADLDELGLARIDVLAHPDLDTLPGAATTATSGAADADLLDADLLDADLLDADLLVATSDLGPSPALLELNRQAVAAARPFLPVWGTPSGGRIGPLVIPGETACLRCAEILGDDAFPPPRPARAEEPPSSAALLGHIAAMEVMKYLAGAPPSDVIGLSIRLDLDPLEGTVRRVLKAPRCPDCSDVARSGAPAVLAGPQIPMRWVGQHE
jgi:bacteriocin biosynthesis cyclodehydratase domain-containing protein